MMNKEDLAQRRADVERRYSELTEDQKKIDAEIKRLEGEHRLLVSLLDAPSAPPAKPTRIRKNPVEGEVTTDAQD